MKKIIAVAVLFAAAFAVPTIPVQAASGDTNCLIFPVLKAECWEKAREIVSAPAEATVAVVEEASNSVKWPVPLWWNCTRAEAGSGHLYDCE